jgi:hypothetical protein
MNKEQQIFKTYSDKLGKLQDFEKINGRILKRHFELQEMEMRAKFKAEEQLDMLMENGEIKEDVFLEDTLCEMRIYPRLKTVQIFAKTN